MTWTCRSPFQNTSCAKPLYAEWYHLYAQYQLPNCLDRFTSGFLFLHQAKMGIRFGCITFITRNCFNLFDIFVSKYIHKCWIHIKGFAPLHCQYECPSVNYPLSCGSSPRMPLRLFQRFFVRWCHRIGSGTASRHPRALPYEKPLNANGTIFACNINFHFVWD